MVVKLIQSNDLEQLEESINKFIIEKDKEKREIREYAKYIPYDFRVDIKVVQGFNTSSNWINSNGQVEREGPKFSHIPYFIAVIQY